MQNEVRQKIRQHADGDEPVILVVDDDRMMLTMLAGLIQHEGYKQVERANGGKEALRKLLQLKPDIVFLDIEMPEIDGLETLRAIKRYGQEHGIASQVVMVSATPSSHNVKTALEIGAVGFLVKPLSARNVAEHIKACLKRAGLRVSED